MNIHHKLIQFHPKNPKLQIGETFIYHHNPVGVGKNVRLFGAAKQSGLMRVINTGQILESQKCNGGVRFATKTGVWMIQDISGVTNINFRNPQTVLSEK